MAEITKKKRAWVKNAIIVFLVIMLILTFFSNTIMNAALPEVSAQYAQPGTITSKIRATSEIQANMIYNVVAETSREIESVAVKQGDIIEPGAILLYLKDEDSSELQEAQKTLDALQLAYDKALLSLPVPDYTADERAIENLQEDLSKLRDSLGSITSGEKKLENLKNAMLHAEQTADAAKNRTEQLNEELTDLQAQQAELAENNDTLKNYLKAVENAQKKLDAANKALDSFTAVDNSEDIQTGIDAKLRELENQNIELKRLKEDYSILESENNSHRTALQNEVDAANDVVRKLEASQPTVGSTGYAVWESQYQEALNTLKAAQDNLSSFVPADTLSKEREIEDKQLEISRTSEELAKLRDALTVASNVKAQKLVLQAEVDQATKNLDIASNQYDEATKQASETLAQKISDVKSRLKNAERSEKSANDALNEATETYNEAKAEIPGMESAEEAVIAKQREIEAAREALEQKKAEDINAAALNNLDMQAQAKELEEQRARVEKLKAQGAGATIISPYGGYVSNINFLAGDSVSMGDTVASIEVIEKGYSMEFPITNEQAKLIRVGDKASLNGWWYADAEITVAALKNDPSNPGKGKIVICNVTGDVTVGQSLSIVLGERGANYDIVVPTSAVREDANGSFILIVESKPSPLGNRYVATRADVTVLASDDTQSAVSGALYGYEFVITTSAKPIEAGELVRLAEN